MLLRPVDLVNVVGFQRYPRVKVSVRAVHVEVIAEMKFAEKLRELGHQNRALTHREGIEDVGKISRQTSGFGEFVQVLKCGVPFFDHACLGVRIRPARFCGWSGWICRARWKD